MERDAVVARADAPAEGEEVFLGDELGVDPRELRRYNSQRTAESEESVPKGKCGSATMDGGQEWNEDERTWSLPSAYQVGKGLHVRVLGKSTKACAVFC